MAPKKSAVKRQVAWGWLAGPAIFLSGLGLYFFVNLPAPQAIILDGQKIKVGLAQTAEEQAKGLSGREKIGDHEGMLFIYDNYVAPSFWMKEMLFPIDIIWLKDGMVAGFNENLPLPEAGKELALYRPKTFINRVLEVPAGFVQKYGVKIGDKVQY